jgi:large subunit ribosomal protein L29
MDIKILRTKSAAEVQKELKDLFREQFNLRMQIGSTEVSRPHLSKLARRNIARVKTILSEKGAKGGK